MGDEKEVIENAKEKASEMVDNATDAISDAEETAAEKVSDVVGEVADAMNESDERLADQVAEKVDDATDAINDAEETAAEKVSDAIDEAADALDESGSSELDELVEELKAAAPESTESTPYSPVGLMTLLQSYFPKLPESLQTIILDNFKEMDGQDLMSIDTWRGLIVVVASSAKAQAEQVTGMVDSVLPDPLKTGNLFGLLRSGADKLTPSILKDAASGAAGVASDLANMASNMEGMSAEDLVDPETWKGLYYMLDLGLRTQVNLLKERVSGGGEEGDNDSFDDFDDFDDWDE